MVKKNLKKYRIPLFGWTKVRVKKAEFFDYQLQIAKFD